MTPQKYTFDRAFGEEARLKEIQQKEAVRLEISQAEERGRQDGIQIGRQQAMAELEAQIAAAASQIATGCEALLAQRETLTEQIRQDTAQLAYTIAARLAPALMGRYPLSEIESLVSECLEFCQREPRIVVRVADPMVDALQGRLEGLTRAKGFAGDVVLLGDPTLHGHDCRVEWPDGGVERNQHDVEAAIEAAIQRFVMAASDNGPDAATPRPEAAVAGSIG